MMIQNLWIHILFNTAIFGTNLFYKIAGFPRFQMFSYCITQELCGYTNINWAQLQNELSVS